MTRLTTALLLAAVVCSSSACVREIEIENLPAEVTSVGPLSLDAEQNVIITFTLRDAEGDDQLVGIDICDAPDSNCGVAEPARGSDPLDRMPTVPKATDVLHEFRWQPWCGRWIDQKAEALELDDEFVVSVRILSSDQPPVYSVPSSLAALGATEGSCE